MLEDAHPSPASLPLDSNPGAIVLQARPSPLRFPFRCATLVALEPRAYALASSMSLLSLPALCLAPSWKFDISSCCFPPLLYSQRMYLAKVAAYTGRVFHIQISQRSMALYQPCRADQIAEQNCTAGSSQAWACYMTFFSGTPFCQAAHHSSACKTFCAGDGGGRSVSLTLAWPTSSACLLSRLSRQFLDCLRCF